VKINTITASSNALLKKIRSLQERQARQKTGLFLIEGERLVLEALNRDIELEAIVVVDNYLDKESELLERLDTVTAVSPALFKELVTTSSPCKVVAIGRWQLSDLNSTLKDGATTVLWGENIQDPGNLGTMIRSALAFGVDALVLTSSVDPFNPKVVRSAMGGLFDLPICLCPLNRAAELLKQYEFEIVAFSPEAKESVDQFSFAKKTALLVGNEGAGLTNEAEGLSDRVLVIPQKPDVESLNVGVAASLALYERMKQTTRLKS